MYRLLLPRESLHGPDGRHLGLSTGSSQDFHEFREYHPGDDLRRLDWDVYARTDHEVIRLYREEITPHVDLYIDVSASMSLPNTRKAEALAALLSTLDAAAAASHCSLTRHSFLPPSAPPPTTPILPTPARPHSLRILLSDLLFPDDPAPLLAPLAEGAAALHVIQLLASEEESPSPSSFQKLIDTETHATLEVSLDPSTLAAYHSALVAHRELWHLACRPLGAHLSTLTDIPILTPPYRLSALELSGLLEPLS